LWNVYIFSKTSKLDEKGGEVIYSFLFSYVISLNVKKVG